MPADDTALDLAVLGRDPRFGGGGNAQTEAFLAAATALGRRPELLVEPHPGLGGGRISPLRIEALRARAASRRLEPAARAARSLWVVTTLAQDGGAAPRSGRPYGCWLGTTIDAEWSGRAPGLPAAHRVLAGLSVPALRRIEWRVLRGATRLYATSPASRASVAAAAGANEASVGLLPIPIDTAHFTPEPDEAWLARLGAPVVGFLGRADDPRKNAGLVLAAFALARERLPTARLCLIGARPDGDLPPGVEATGFVADVVAPLRECALLVSPSRQEGFGIAVAEALACGVPALVTPSGGPEEMVRASGAGRVTAGFGEDELAAAIVELLSDREELTSQRARGRAYVETEHAPARFRTLLAEALEAVDG